ncbi:bacteriohemerythrin [Pseudothauera rhizosphaerae]|uniref:Bacteriohemerythrin n=1 Tax=Pseudothauera rhizosphaerae TaxID=2565932 RepID=A0A4S4AG33_9RHOO|nr:bacteriohemerythrin [Pseudothauera rhizosphaerae]THF58091.1 bacteriohemerythrin [Pseudothauera rhizosphaerae]
MEQLAWSDALRTGVDVIDRQHRGLVDMVNAVAIRLDAEKTLSADEVRLLVGYLKDYAEVHFGTEEALMALCGVSPDYAEHHHRNHERFLAHVGDMIDDLSENAVPDGRQLLAFLGDWLIRHIQGEDQGLARRLREASAAGHGEFHSEAQVGGGIGSTGLTRGFADVLALGSATLHASESDVLEMIAEGTSPTLVMALDASLLPVAVLHANAAAETLFGVPADELQARSAAQLFGEAQVQRLPVVMSEVLMHGAYEGEFDCVVQDGRAKPVPVRITHLVLQGRMVILTVFASQAGRARGGRRAAAVAEEHGTLAGRTVLSRHPLFQDLGREEMALLEKAARLVCLQKGQVLFQKGDEPEGAYIVISGQMSLSASNTRGAEKVLDILDPPQVFAEVEVLTRQPAAVHAHSLTSTVLLLIPADALRRVQASSLSFGTALLAHLGRRVHKLTGEIEALTLHTAMERIIDHLLEHASVNAHGVVEALLPAQKQVIASYLNISPPTLSRAFQTLTDNGLITISRRYVTIPDRERLLRFRDEGIVAQRV